MTIGFPDKFAKKVATVLAEEDHAKRIDAMCRRFARELREWWSFNDQQIHTHTWHTREDFIEKMLPKLVAEAMNSREP